MLDIGSAKVGWYVITLVQSLTQSLRQHQWDSNTRYRDNPHFQDPLRLKKGYAHCALHRMNFKFWGFAKRLRFDINIWEEGSVGNKNGECLIP